MSSRQEYFARLRDKQRQYSLKAANKGVVYRQQLLSQLKRLLEENNQAWLSALKSDLHKPAVEAYASELGVLLNEIEDVQKNLSDWLTPETKTRMLLTGLEQVTISRRPYGSVLVIAPWNYPLQLALMPVIGALAAGNSIVLKPSEFAPAVSRLLAELVPQYFDKEQIAVVEGDAHVAEELTAEAWDFIFFTGSPHTGQKVYEAAAKHLTPVLLELGGKNPCILDETGFTAEAVRAIAWGKFLNAGQSCIAPDTVYVSRAIYQAFIEQMATQVEKFYGKNPSQSEDFGRMIHEKHFKKVASFLKDGRVVYGGAISKEELYISPTLLVDIKSDSAAATEEIFGPVLPVVPYDDLTALIDELSLLSTPLVMYVYSKNKQVVEQIDQRLESGALSQNQVILHSTSPNLSFGGKGASGIGRYHGKASVQAMSYEKSRYTKNTLMSFSSQYPPYTKKALAALRTFRKHLF